MTEEVFDSVYSLNVKVPYFLVAELAPLMAKRGKGAIVNLSTMVSDYGAVGMSLYGSSKAAINLLTKTWAAEYGPSGVRVNAVSPGPTRTEGTDAMGKELEQLAAQAPAGRPATADEIAEAIVFLATDRASFIHGAKLPSTEGARPFDVLRAGGCEFHVNRARKQIQAFTSAPDRACPQGEPAIDGGMQRRQALLIIASCL